jgi:glucose-6-phosphate isomerase
VLLPESIAMDARTGAVSPSTGQYTKRLSELRGIFSDGTAFERQVSGGVPVVYEVAEYRKEGSNLFFGATIMAPGKVGDESCGRRPAP